MGSPLDIPDPTFLSRITALSPQGIIRVTTLRVTFYIVATKFKVYMILGITHFLRFNTVYAACHSKIHSHLIAWMSNKYAVTECR